MIITILGTIGFVSYESYLSVGRDTAKISFMKDMYNAFGNYATIPYDGVTRYYYFPLCRFCTVFLYGPLDFLYLPLVV